MKSIFKSYKIKQFVFYTILVGLCFLLFNCNSLGHDEKLQTDSNQAWVYEGGGQKIAFTMNASGYKNYIFDYELDVIGSVDVGFHTDRNILYFHFDMYDQSGNYIGVGGDSLYIAENPGAPVNLYEFKIMGNKLILTKPLYSYVDPCQGKPFGDVFYVFTKKKFTPPSSLPSYKMNIIEDNNIVGNSPVRSDKIILPTTQQHPFSVSFTYQINDNQEVPAFIYDIRGQRIQTIGFKNGHLIWYGTDYDGNPVPPGLYFYLIMSEEYIWNDVLFLM